MMLSRAATVAAWSNLAAIVLGGEYSDCMYSNACAPLCQDGRSSNDAVCADDSLEFGFCAEELASGDSCQVSCKAGFAGTSATYACPCPNDTPIRGDRRTGMKEGTMPGLQGAAAACQAVVACAPLSEQGASVDESSCAAVGAGGHCGLDCAAGYAGPTRTLTCPADNTDPYLEPQGGESPAQPSSPGPPPQATCR